MRNNPETITTETIAESIAKNEDAVFPSVHDRVQVIKERLNRIAQVQGIDRFFVHSRGVTTLLDAYEDRQRRGVYDAEDVEGVAQAVAL